MPSMIWIVLLSAAAASSIGGLLLCLRDWSKQAMLVMISAGAGLLLAITFLDLMPHVWREKGEQMMPFVLVGFSLVYVLEMFSPTGKERGTPGMVGIMTVFLLHAFIEGVSLITSFRLDAEVGYSILFALLLHKIPDGIAVASLVLAVTHSRRKAVWGAASLGIATWVGALSMGAVGEIFPANWSAVMLAITTGIFLYLSASHLVPYIQKARSMQPGITFFAAIIAYLLLSLYLHGSHTHV
ncbi:divalent heavy-metal cations transporter [Brevibacillus panacihumi W25]|uniref:Divalent heavy-metal cations transporter n=1 Tax=Brevibacillus panacihumi W25 TaxID=1408254 RepID=V6M2Z6_9BACL|nr:ZIP family metal transporter [Brevibacillus panacihumi]EST52991.1 divalent heavy-metal cations transporter [Brevibacillus panacihumi W25]